MYMYIYIYLSLYIYIYYIYIYTYIVIVCDHEITHKLCNLPRQDIYKTIWPLFVDRVQLPQG